MKDIIFTEIYDHIKNGTLEDYLEQTEHRNSLNNRWDIHYNGTRPIATWIINMNTPEERAVDICLEIDGEGKPLYFERTDFEDAEIAIFETFEYAFAEMLEDIEEIKEGLINEVV